MRPHLIFSFMSPLPLLSTLFPYTTLFRSPIDRATVCHRPRWADRGGQGGSLYLGGDSLRQSVAENRRQDRAILLDRSEEHTSELQSRVDLVCRLLLEKKKKQKETQQRQKT